MSNPPEMILQPEAPADTSCVTGLPARANYRSCRLFFAVTFLPQTSITIICEPADSESIVWIYHTEHEANSWLRSVGPGHNGSIGTVDKPLRRCPCLQRKGAIQASSTYSQRQPANRNLFLSPLSGDCLQNGGKNPRSTAPATMLLPLRPCDGTQQPAQLF